MKRYRMTMLVRSDEHDEESMKRGEWQVKCHITATSQVAARRFALERAYAEHLLVSRFLQIEERVV